MAFIVPYNALKHRVLWGKLRVLGKISDIQVPPPCHCALIRLLKSCHQPQEGGFACAVDANDADLLPFIYREVRVVKKQPFRI